MSANVLIVSTSTYANYVMIATDVSSRIVRGVEIPDVRPGISFDFEPLGNVPMPMLHGAGMNRGIARGQIDLSAAARKAGISETEVARFFAEHADYGSSLLAVDKTTWRVLSKDELVAGTLKAEITPDIDSLQDAGEIPRRVEDNPDFEDRGERIDGKRVVYDLICGRSIKPQAVYPHARGIVHRMKRAELEASQILPLAGDETMTVGVQDSA